MFILSFFIKVKCCLITDKKLMAAVTDVYCRSVNLITIANIDAMETAAH